MKPEGVIEEQIKLRIFPFSLADKPKDQLCYLLFGSIPTWTEIKTWFLEKFSPAPRAASIRKDIFRIKQFNGECTSIGKGSNSYVQVTLIIKSLPNFSMNIFMKDYQQQIGKSLPMKVRRIISNMVANDQQFDDGQEYVSRKVNEVRTSFVE